MLKGSNESCAALQTQHHAHRSMIGVTLSLMQGDRDGVWYSTQIGDAVWVGT